MTRHIEAGTAATISVANPESVRLTFELTLSVGEWRALLEELPNDNGNVGALHKMIRTLAEGSLKAIGQRATSTGWSAYAPVEEPSP